MYCKDCKHWTRNEEYDKYFGKCNSDKFVDMSQDCSDLTDENDLDKLTYSDYEGYQASFSTGEKFGCIHFSKAD